MPAAGAAGRAPSSTAGPSRFWLVAAAGVVAVLLGTILVVTADTPESATPAVSEVEVTEPAPATATPSTAPAETTAASTAPATAMPPTSSAPATVAPTTAAPATTVPPTTAPATTAPATTAPGTTAPPTTVPGGAAPLSADEVPESKAVVRNGQIFLEGAVPTQEAADEIVALAAEVLGPGNVINDYVIDPRAGDPSLGNITVEDTINFPTGSAEILPESEGLLNQGLALLSLRPAMTIRIVGHTDDRGSEDFNQDLSEQRADAVKQWWVDRGVDPARLEASGAGESEPTADNATAEGRRLNRRIQFFLENILG